MSKLSASSELTEELEAKIQSNQDKLKEIENLQNQVGSDSLEEADVDVYKGMKLSCQLP